MAHKIFVDADVIIDFLTDRAPHANPASELFELSEQGKIELYVSAVSINNVYYIVRRTLGHNKTLEVIELLAAMAEIVATTKNEIIDAVRSEFADYEDAVQYQSALKVKGLVAIVTRNIKDYKTAEMAVMTPINFLKMIQP